MKNSSLYECTVMHHRLEPKKNRFSYKIFMFSLDLDEINDVVKENFFISRNRFNLFNFRDKDHIQLPKENPDASKDIKQHVIDYAVSHGVIRNDIKRITLITNLSTLGYQFNPVSFYYCYDHYDQPLCCIVEVCNTYREMKIFFLGKDSLKDKSFESLVTKNFYVSPFIDMDTDFHFDLRLPDERLKIGIDDYQEGRRFFVSTLTGIRKPLTNWSVLTYAFRFPFITLQVITLIHWQALRLWIKKFSYHKKDSCIDLQKDVLRPHKSIAQ